MRFHPWLWLLVLAAPGAYAQAPDPVSGLAVQISPHTPSAQLLSASQVIPAGTNHPGPFDVLHDGDWTAFGVGHGSLSLTVEYDLGCAAGQAFDLSQASIGADGVDTTGWRTSSWSLEWKLNPGDAYQSAFTNSPTPNSGQHDVSVSGAVACFARITANSNAVGTEVRELELWGAATDAGSPPPPPPPPPPPGTGDLSLLATHLAAPGEWSLVPGTAFTGNICTLEAWNGAASDATRVWFSGGGHNCSTDNSVWQLDLETITLTQLIGSTFPAQPSSVHTYDGFTYCGGKLWYISNRTVASVGEAVVSYFDLSTNSWVDAGQGTGHAYSVSACNGNELISLNMRAGGNQWFRVRDSSSGDWIRGQNSGLPHWDNGNAQMHNGEFWMTARVAGVSRLFRANITTFAVTEVSPLPAGLDYQAGFDIRNGKIWFNDQSTNVWSYDIAGNSWQGFSAASGPVDPFGQSKTFSRWGYLPSLDAFWLYNEDGSGLWLYTPIDHNPPPQAHLTRPLDTLPTYAAISSGADEGVFQNNHASSCPNPCAFSIDGGALRITPNNSGSAQYFVNYSPLTQSGDTVYIAWEQMVDAAYLNGGFLPGWKQIQVTHQSAAGTCTDDEVVVQNIFNRGFPQGYHGCPGAPGRFNFEESCGGSCVTWQPPNALCSTQSTSGCWAYEADVWMSFQMQITVGGSVVLWGAKPGDTDWLQIMDADANPIASPNGLGRVVLSTFDAGPGQGSTWFRNLVVSPVMVAR